MTAHVNRCAARSGAGRITAMSDRTRMLDRAGEAPGYVLTRHARARVGDAVGDATT